LKRALAWVTLAVVAAGSVLVTPFSPAAGQGAPPPPGPPAAETKAAPLPPCKHVPGARCGRVTVPLDRLDPSVGTIDIAFELHPRRNKSKPSLGTIVAVEGGPGYSTTASRDYFLDLFRPLLGRRRLLLVDNRGTGRSGAILCQPLQSDKGNYVNAVGRCGEQLGPASDLYGSGNAADDLAAVLDELSIERVDLYGDSYGTFFGQTFALRHPERLRSLVLDGAYFVAGNDPWYRDTNRSLRDAFHYVCERSPSCAARRGNTVRLIVRLARHLRERPISGRAANADGESRKVKVDVGGLIYLVTAAATSPTIYRELDAAGRAALRAKKPYYRPLLRLAAETFSVGGAGPVRGYSEGLYVAVACNDYPQPYDMTSPIDERPAQYQSSIEDLELNAPEAFDPFTVEEWVTSPVEYYDSCLKWPVPSMWDTPVSPGTVWPDTPVLVLNGDLDSLTSPEGGQDAANAFPNSTYVEVANITHVTAISDFGRCASTLVVRFVRQLDAGDTSCAAEYAEVRTVDRFARRSGGLDRPARRRSVRIAGATVGDVMARWLNMYGTEGVGLRGGRFTTWGLRNVKFRLNGVRYVKDVAVSGDVTWDRPSGRVRARVQISGPGTAPGRLFLRWNHERPLATMYATGGIGTRKVKLSMPAP
jgi:pimeloyl-ACP methyl ester carboxylesterase